MNTVPIILVTDDCEANRELLEAWLIQEGYEVAMAENGQAALDYVREHPVDVILLDVMMPRVDGFEVCQRIKNEPGIGFIPVVLVTGLKEVEHRIHANEVSADDFLSKPVNQRELLTRVKSLVKLKHTHEELRRANQRIAHQNDELNELHQLKEELSQLLVHDLQNPLTCVSSYIELVMMDAKDLGDRHKKFLSNSLESCEELRNMLLTLLDISVLELGKLSILPERNSLQELTESVVEHFLYASAERQGVTIRNELPDDLPELICDRELIKRTILNLLSNALKFSPSGGEIQVLGYFNGSEIVYEVIDQGPGVPEEFRETIFEKFTQVESKARGVRVGRGLGLSFCKMAIEAHGGRIWETNHPSGGSRFSFAIPLEIPATSAETFSPEPSLVAV